MPTITHEHVVDHGKVPCVWKRAEVAVAECAACPAFRGRRDASTIALAHVEFVRCDPPIAI